MPTPTEAKAKVLSLLQEIRRISKQAQVDRLASEATTQMGFITTAAVIQPANPTLLADAGDGEVTLTMAPGASSAAPTHFTLNRGTSASGPWSGNLLAGTERTFVDTGRTNGVTYHYRAKAFIGLIGSLGFGTDSATPIAIIIESFNPTYPRLHAHRMSAPTTLDVAQIQFMARCDTAAWGGWRRWTANGGTYNLANFATYIKSFNPNLKLFASVNLSNQSNNPTSADSDIYNKLNDGVGPNGVGDWWLYSPPPAVKIQGFTANFNLCNYTAFVTPDVNNRTFAKWLAHYHMDASGSGLDHLTTGKGLSEGPWDGVFQDDCRVRASAGNPSTDWDRDGTADLATDTDIIAARGNGISLFISELKAINPNHWHLANRSGDFNAGGTPGGFTQIMEAAFYERVTFVEGPQGWATMMSRYRAGMAELKDPKILVFNNDITSFKERYTTAPQNGYSDQHISRYFLCSCLMDNGYYSVNKHPPFGNGYQEPMQFEDMFGCALNTKGYLGYPIDPPQLTAWNQGVYKREFDNGLVLVSPRGNGTKTVQLTGGPWKRMNGTEVNTGALNVTSYQITEQDGIILLRAQ